MGWSNSHLWRLLVQGYAREGAGFSIRLAYYHLPCKGERWRFASQMIVETKPGIIRPLLERTFAKTGWLTKPEVGRFR
jgi:hypothetical protein